MKFVHKVLSIHLSCVFDSNAQIIFVSEDIVSSQK